MNAGKTIWLYYAFARRLSDSRPVLLQTTVDLVYLFTNDGVFQIKLPSLQDGHLTEHLPWNTWCLIDSNMELRAVHRFVAQSKRFIIQAASPRTKRLDRVRKESTRRRHYIMKPMTVEEVLAG